MDVNSEHEREVRTITCKIWRAKPQVTRSRLAGYYSYDLLRDPNGQCIDGTGMSVQIHQDEVQIDARPDVKVHRYDVENPYVTFKFFYDQEGKGLLSSEYTFWIAVNCVTEYLKEDGIIPVSLAVPKHSSPRQIRTTMYHKCLISP